MSQAEFVFILKCKPEVFCFLIINRFSRSQNVSSARVLNGNGEGWVRGRAAT